MKKMLLVVSIAGLLSVHVFAQARLDLGVVIPKGGGVLTGGSLSGTGEVAAILRDYFLPFPEASVYYQWKADPYSFAAGIRFYTLILESIGWPDLLAEVRLGPVFIDARIGGGLFGMFGLMNAFDAGQVFIPDLSAWLSIGKRRQFRLGGGAMGLMAPEVSGSDMLLLFYFGGKVSITF